MVMLRIVSFYTFINIFGTLWGGKMANETFYREEGVINLTLKSPYGIFFSFISGNTVEGKGSESWTLSF